MEIANTVTIRTKVQFSVCSVCGEPIARVGDDGIVHARFVQFEAPRKVKRASHDLAVCDDCTNAGKLSFTCTYCEKTLPSDQIAFSWAERDECICNHCFSTVTLKEWRDFCSETE